MEAARVELWVTSDEVAHGSAAIVPDPPLPIGSRKGHLRRLRPGAPVQHTARLILAAIAEGRVGSQTVGQFKGQLVGGAHRLHGCDLPVRQAGIAAVSTVWTTQGFDVEGLGAGIRMADQPVGKPIQSVAGTEHAFAHQCDLGRVEPASLLLHGAAAVGARGLQCDPVDHRDGTDDAVVVGRIALRDD